MTTTSEIADSVVAIGDRLAQIFTSNGWNKTVPMAQTFGDNGSKASADMIIAYVKTVAERIRPLKEADYKKGDLEGFLASIPAQANAINFDNLQQNPTGVFGGAMAFLQAVDGRLPPAPLPKPEIDWVDIKSKDLLPKDLARRLRSIESRLLELEPRSAEVDRKIGEIEAAHAAAEQLPTDMQELASQRETMVATVSAATKLSAQIELAGDKANENTAKIKTAQDAAASLIERSEQALRGSTGVGLAMAFEKRKESLTLAGIAWTVGLMLALGAALFIGAERVSTLKDVLISDRSATVIWVNALLAVLGIAAPVWFGWLSTKQIWTNFRLAEDYAFKASVSKAYEGYRAEAISIDPALQARLFASALTRLEEAPIRLLDMETHGTPLQELLSNPTIRKTLEGVPGIADKILALIPKKGAVAAALAGSAAVAAAAAGAGKPVGEDEPEPAEDK